MLDGRVLQPALIAALGTGAVILVLRLLRRQPLTGYLAGFAGVAISAYVSSRTGEARDFFLWGLIVNVAYGAAFPDLATGALAVDGVVVRGHHRRPTGVAQGESDLRRVAAATWVWVFVFGARIVVGPAISPDGSARWERPRSSWAGRCSSSGPTSSPTSSAQSSCRSG